MNTCNPRRFTATALAEKITATLVRNIPNPGTCKDSRDNWRSLMQRAERSLSARYLLAKRALKGSLDMRLPYAPNISKVCVRVRVIARMSSLDVVGNAVAIEGGQVKVVWSSGDTTLHSPAELVIVTD